MWQQFEMFLSIFEDTFPNKIKLLNLTTKTDLFDFLRYKIRIRDVLVQLSDHLLGDIVFVVIEQTLEEV